MKVSYELKQGYIDIWNEESEEYDRYIKVNKKSVVEEEKKIPKKLNLDIDELRGKETPRTIDYLIEDKINQVIDYLKSKGDE